MNENEEHQLIGMESWNPELGFFPKKEIEGKTHQTEITRGYAERKEKRLVYMLETYDSIFGNRKIQITNNQAIKLKSKSVPFKLYFQVAPTVVNGKDCFSLKISENKQEWF